MENLKLIRGDTLAFGFEIDGTTELDDVYFSIKKTLFDTDYAVQKSIGDGVEKIDDEHYTVRVAPDDTFNLDVGVYYYDLQIEKNGDVFTVMHGTLDLIPDITRDTTEPTPPEPPTPPSLIKDGWYYVVYNTQALVGHFDVEQGYLFILNFDLSGIDADHDDLNGGQWSEYTLDGNTITTALPGVELSITDEGVLSYPLAGVTFEYDDNLDISILRRLAE